MRRLLAVCLALGLALTGRAVDAQQPAAPVSTDPLLVPGDADSLWTEIDRLQVRLAALENERNPGVVAADYELAQPAAAPNESAGQAAAPCSTPCGMWDGGASVYVLSPHWAGGNVAYLSGDFLPSELDQQNFAAPLSAAPAVWLGYFGPSGYGVQTDFFQYSQSLSQTTFPPAGQVLVDPYSNVIDPFGAPFHAASSLDILYWDLELTKRLEFDDWTWTASAGLRYLHLRESYEADDFLASSVAEHTFNGCGPTVALAGRRPIGSWGWGVYGNCRGSLLFGPQNYLATLNDVINGTLDVRNNALGVMPTADIEFGLDCQRPLCGGRCTLTIQTGLVGQAYFGAGAPSAIAPISPFGPFTLGSATTSSLDATLGLIGFRSSIGIAF